MVVDTVVNQEPINRIRTISTKKLRNVPNILLLQQFSQWKLLILKLSYLRTPPIPPHIGTEISGVSFPAKIPQHP